MSYQIKSIRSRLTSKQLFEWSTTSLATDKKFFVIEVEFDNPVSTTDFSTINEKITDEDRKFSKIGVGRSSGFSYTADGKILEFTGIWRSKNDAIAWINSLLKSAKVGP